MKKFSAFIEARGTLGNIVFWFAVVAACFAVFGLVIGPPFRESTGGLDAIDQQFPLNPEIIYSQLASYTEETKQLYVWFAVVDYIFPPAFAMFIAVLWAWLFAKAPNGAYSFLVSAGLFALPFIVALLDWLENIGFLLLIFNYPAELPRVADVSTALRQAKVTVMGINIVLTLVFIVLTLGLSWRRRRNSAAA